MGKSRQRHLGFGSCFHSKLYLTRDLVDDACIHPHIAVPKSAPKPAPKPPGKGGAKGKKKKYVQEFTMCYCSTKKGFISEPVNL